jgi:hypothetical protein
LIKSLKKLAIEGPQHNKGYKWQAYSQHHT